MRDEMIEALWKVLKEHTNINSTADEVDQEAKRSFCKDIIDTVREYGFMDEDEATEFVLEGLERPENEGYW